MTKASTTQKRQPKGIETGGQFAASANPESTVVLVAATTIYPASELKPGHRVLIRDVTCEVLCEPASGDADRFGRPMSAIQMRRLDTGEEGPVLFGPGGVVHMLPATTDATGSAMDSTSPEVQSGKVFDTVDVVDHYEINGHWHDSTDRFYRRRPGVFGGTPYAMRIQANRPLNDEEMRKMAGLMGYAYRATIAGEPIGSPMRDSPYSFVVSSDMTKSSRDDLGMGLEDFEESLPRVLAEGSPIRKTNRAGAGTQGTRLVEGFGSDLTFELYYDDVCQLPAHLEEDPRFSDERFDRI
jgi:hypothetical protein